jgi:hypothetical protein
MSLSIVRCFSVYLPPLNSQRGGQRFDPAMTRVVVIALAGGPIIWAWAASAMWSSNFVIALRTVSGQPS